MKHKNSLAIAAFCTLLGGCSTTGFKPVIAADTVPETISEKGAYKAFKAALTASQNSSTDANNRGLMLRGFELVQQVCRDNFASAGDSQRWVFLGKDVVGAAGTLATSVLALRSGNARSTEVVALATSVSFTGFDIYTKNFLFAAENVDSVRELVVNALTAHEDKLDDYVPRSYGDAVIQIMDHQDICSPAKILALVKDAIKNGKVVAQTVSDEASELRTLADAKTLERMGRSLGLIGPISIDEARALYWTLLYANGGPTAEELKKPVKDALSRFSADWPLEKLTADTTKLEGLRNELRLLSRPLRARFDAEIAEARTPKTTPAASSNAQSSGSDGWANKNVSSAEPQRGAKRVTVNVR